MKAISVSNVNKHNPLHLLSHLPGAKKDLEQWCDQICGSTSA